MRADRSDELPGIEEVNLAVRIPGVKRALSLHDVTRGRGETLTELGKEATLNRQAARRLLGLEGASVYEELDLETIERANPIAAAAERKARQVETAEQAIAQATSGSEGQLEPAMVRLASDLNQRAAERFFGPEVEITPSYDQDSGTETWTVTLQRDVGEALIITQQEKAGEGEISIRVTGADEVRLDWIDDEDMWKLVDFTAVGAADELVDGFEVSRISVAAHLEDAKHRLAAINRPSVLPTAEELGIGEHQQAALDSMKQNNPAGSRPGLI